MNKFTHEQHDALTRIADFDHVFRVHADGSVDDYQIPAGLYAPEAYDPDLNATTLDGWELPLSGLTGQYGYNGPWLHDSERIGGGVAEVVLSTPGYWVAIYATHSSDDHNHPDGSEPCEETIQGWTLAYLPLPTSDMRR